MKTHKSFVHDSSFTHVTGQSKFVDDLVALKNEVVVGVLTSPVSRGKIKKLDFSKALRLPGILGIYNYKDFFHNKWGAVIEDQPILAEDEVFYVGQGLLIIAGQNLDVVHKAKGLIDVEFVPIAGTYNINQAIKKGSYLGEVQYLKAGNCDEVLKKCPHIIEGQFSNGGQDHFYLESQCAIVYPLENGHLEVHSSTQHPSEVQRSISDALGKDHHQVVVKVKRLGGGFGGKESQASLVAKYCALVADKLKLPARMVYNKDDDMVEMGKRHPFLTYYEVGFNEQGKILAIKGKVYSDGGAYLDLSAAILQRALFHLDNAYFIENVDLEGRICKTNYSPNTAFRGFGGPQGVAVIENIIEEIADFFKMDPLLVRKLNCYSSKNGCKTPYGQEVMAPELLGQMLDNVAHKTNYFRKYQEYLEFNQKSSNLLKGISITPVKFGISFTARFLNQGNALIHLLQDGTVQVSTGAVEMGQGVNTKIQQVVAECFGLKQEKVYILATCTERNANTSATAASSGSDINASAALIAAMNIKLRLMRLAYLYFTNKELLSLSPANTPAEFKEDEFSDISDETLNSMIIFHEGQVSLANGDVKKFSVSLEFMIKLAYWNRVSLSEYAFYKTPQLQFDSKKSKGHPFLYFTQGVACSEVEIDRFTGESKLTSVSILMDLGRPLNKLIDEGQTIGAFVQGYGWVTMEELVYDEQGRLQTHGPSTYKIPGIGDVPENFKVEFIENDNKLNLKGSKAVGEPPFLLSLSAFFAIKNAIVQYTKRPSHLSIPATNEKILLELEDQ